MDSSSLVTIACFMALAVLAFVFVLMLYNRPDQPTDPIEKLQPAYLERMRQRAPAAFVSVVAVQAVSQILKYYTELEVWNIVSGIGFVVLGVYLALKRRQFVELIANEQAKLFNYH